MTVRDSQRPWEAVRGMQQLHEDSDRQPDTMRNTDRHEATAWVQRDSEKQPATIVDFEIHAANVWNW